LLPLSPAFLLLLLLFFFLKKRQNLTRLSRWPKLLSSSYLPASASQKLELYVYACHHAQLTLTYWVTLICEMLSHIWSHLFLQIVLWLHNAVHAILTVIIVLESEWDVDFEKISWGRLSFWEHDL
jgi:hypothetical protein